MLKGRVRYFSCIIERTAVGSNLKAYFPYGIIKAKING